MHIDGIDGRVATVAYACDRQLRHTVLRHTGCARRDCNRTRLTRSNPDRASAFHGQGGALFVGRCRIRVQTASGKSRIRRSLILSWRATVDPGCTATVRLACTVERSLAIWLHRRQRAQTRRPGFLNPVRTEHRHYSVWHGGTMTALHAAQTACWLDRRSRRHRCLGRRASHWLSGLADYTMPATFQPVRSCSFRAHERRRPSAHDAQQRHRHHSRRISARVQLTAALVPSSRVLGLRQPGRRTAIDVVDAADLVVAMYALMSAPPMASSTT